MKLRHSPTSPYVRKVCVTAIELGLMDKIEKIATNMQDPQCDIATDNPLGKVPALLLDGGGVLFDSPVICEYLDSAAGGGRLFPAAGDARWGALRQQALADGIMDAAILRMIERMRRPEELRWDGWMAHQKDKVGRAVDALDREAADLNGALTIGQIAVACALGYLDFRFGDEDWRPGHPRLAGWYEGFAARPSMQETRPPA